MVVRGAFDFGGRTSLELDTGVCLTGRGALKTRSKARRTESPRYGSSD